MISLEPLWVATTRDIVIILMGLAVFVFFLVGLVFAVILGLLSRALLKKSLSVMDENVKPLLDSAKASADHVTSYVSQAAVTPIVKTYGVIAGVRRAASVLAGLTGADTGSSKKKPGD
jgi:hypothetical protein